MLLISVSFFSLRSLKKSHITFYFISLVIFNLEQFPNFFLSFMLLTILKNYSWISMCLIIFSWLESSWTVLAGISQAIPPSHVKRMWCCLSLYFPHFLACLSSISSLKYMLYESRNCVFFVHSFTLRSHRCLYLLNRWVYSPLDFSPTLWDTWPP